MPKVSYVCSCYNAKPDNGQQIFELINDLLYYQIERDVELIIVDSQSPGKEADLVEQDLDCQDEIHRGRLKVIRQSERTPYGVSWMEGWKYATGHIVSNSNLDDRSKPWRTCVIDKVAFVEGLKSDAPYKFFYGGYDTYKNGKLIASGFPPPFSVEDWQNYFRAGIHIHWHNDIKNIVDWELIYYAAHRLRSAFDYWFCLYLITLGVKGIAIPKVLSIYNQRDESLEQSDKNRSMFEGLYSIEQFFPQSLAIQNLKKDASLYEQFLTFKKANFT